jgi:hypothetical protein
LAVTRPVVSRDAFARCQDDAPARVHRVELDGEEERSGLGHHTLQHPGKGHGQNVPERKHDQENRLCPCQQRRMGSVHRHTRGDAELLLARLAMPEPVFGMKAVLPSPPLLHNGEPSRPFESSIMHYPSRPKE